MKSARPSMERSRHLAEPSAPLSVRSTKWQAACQTTAGRGWLMLHTSSTGLLHLLVLTCIWVTSVSTARSCHFSLSLYSYFCFDWMQQFSSRLPFSVHSAFLCSSFSFSSCLISVTLRAFSFLLFHLHLILYCLIELPRFLPAISFTLLLPLLLLSDIP